jgi:hypothetical protein
MALAALKEFYEIAGSSPPGLREPSRGVAFRRDPKMPVLRRSDRSDVFRKKLSEIERKLTIDVDRWCAEMADMRINFAKSLRQLIALSPDTTKQLSDINKLIRHYDDGDAKRNEIIASIKRWIERQPPEAADRPPQDIVFFQDSCRRFIALLEQERDARRRFRNDLPGLRDELLASRYEKDEGFVRLAVNEAKRCYDRIMTIASLPKGWHDGEGEKVSERAIEIAKEFVGRRPEMAGILHIYPTIGGGILFEFEWGKWDLSLDILPTGTIELYGVKIDSDEAMEPLSFTGLGQTLMKEIDIRIGAK